MGSIYLVIYNCHTNLTNLLCCPPTWFSPLHGTLWEVPQTISMLRYTYLLLESLTHSLADNHLETDINLKYLSKHMSFGGRRESEGEFEDKSEKSSTPHDSGFPLFPEFS